ncbi:NAD-dependent epimerase/dehydratase family protein [Acetobacteraceae bacterium]|nr:NAD-dependent epimerase/dehydratase family protein [Acetobacteraceae bacterium]
MNAQKPLSLVTGATGFVGAAVARALQERGYPLRLLVRKNANRQNLKNLDAEIVEGDLNDPASLRKAMLGVGALFHVAADYRLWVPNPSQMNRINIEGTRNIIKEALKEKVTKIVYCSSVATMPTALNGRPTIETDIVTEAKIVGAYKRSKYHAEQEVLRMVREEKAPVVIVNPSTPIGRGDIKPTPTGQVIFDCVRGKMPAYVETGLNVVDVDDVGLGHVLAFEKGRIGERYILGGEDIKLGDLFSLVARKAGVKAPVWRLNPDWLYPFAIFSELFARISGKTPRLHRDTLTMAKKIMYFSSSKARKELGYNPVSAEQAVTSAVQWFQKFKQL